MKMTTRLLKLRYGIKGSDEDLDELAGKVRDLLAELSDPEYQEVLKRAAYLRPWRPARRGWANVLDQLAHIALGLVVLLPVLLLHSVWGALFSGLMMGIIRETEQYFNQDLHIRMLKDRALDIVTIALGAALAWKIGGLV